MWYFFSQSFCKWSAAPLITEFEQKENQLLEITSTTRFIYLGSQHKKVLLYGQGTYFHVSCVASSSVCYIPIR